MRDRARLSGPWRVTLEVMRLVQQRALRLTVLMFVVCLFGAVMAPLPFVVGTGTDVTGSGGIDMITTWMRR